MLIVCTGITVLLPNQLSEFHSISFHFASSSSPGPPVVSDVHMTVTEDGLLQGAGTFQGSDEGASQFQWYRQRVKSKDDVGPSADLEPIEFATSLEYEPDEADYGCRLLFG